MISPPGTSATVQGLVAGMDDGLGFSIGSLFGGFLFQKIGGRDSFRFFAILALVTCFAHFILRPASTHEIRASAKATNQTVIANEKALEADKEIAVEEKMLTEN